MPRAGAEAGEAPVRITGGAARGIEISVPKGDSVRPATDAMRQAVFSSLGARVAGARFVDLFAGSGAYGLEALSRGASGGTFVERSAKAGACLRRNIAAVCRSMGGDESAVDAVEADALSLPAGTGAPPDLVFVDPPYDDIPEVAPVLFQKLLAALGPSWGGLVVFELPGEQALEPPGWRCVKRLGRGARQPSVAFLAPAP
jgi:16S rRNA (guanine966-N2)-methyltransferase